MLLATLRMDMPRHETHYSDVIMRAMTSRITGVSIVCSAVCSGADQRKHQSSASLSFVRGIHRWPVDSPHKGPVTRKCFHLMPSSCRGRGLRPDQRGRIIHTICFIKCVNRQQYHHKCCNHHFMQAGGPRNISVYVCTKCQAGISWGRTKHLLSRICSRKN